MKSINELFDEAEKVNKENPDAFICDREKQHLREQWVLGKFCGHYNNLSVSKAVYAEKYKPIKGRATPDFAVFDTSKKWIFDLEITEALDKNRKRCTEYRENRADWSWIPKEEYLPIVQERICEKSSKDYPRPVILVVYLNVFASIYNKFCRSTFSSLHLPTGQLSQVWLLNTGGDLLRLDE